jgi:hypothetical protein
MYPLIGSLGGRGDGEGDVDAVGDGTLASTFSRDICSNGMLEGGINSAFWYIVSVPKVRK